MRYFPIHHSLSQNYPNPFNPSTSINYQISRAGFVSIKLYDTLGHLVETLVAEEKSIGNYKITLDGTNLSSGVYFCRMITNDFQETKKLILMK